MNPRLFGTLFLLALSPVLRADFVTLWELGTDNESQTDFTQESGSNEPPGFVSLPDEVPPGSENDGNFNLPSKDDDYYFAGLYPDPIGLVDQSEPWKAFERALVPGDGTNRIHFILDAAQAAATNRLRFTVDTFALGAAEGITSTHDLQLMVNGQEIFTQTGIIASTLIEKVVSAGAVSAVPGENVLEINRTGGSDASWIQFDYIRAEVDTDLCADPLCAFTSSATEAAPGQSITLNWIASPTSSLVLNPGAVNVTPLTTNGLGSITLVPDGTTTYALTATKGASVQTRELTVTVPLLQSFASNRTSLSLNEKATLFWRADPKATLTIYQGVGSVNGATDASGNGLITVTPGNQERVYTLTATRGANTATATVTLGYGEFGTLWTLGTDDNSQAEFHQEAGTNPAPGSPTVLDDDFYFLGAYPDPLIGTLYTSENPATNFERAVTGGSTTTRVHFTLSEPTPPPASQVRLSVDLIGGGWWDAAAAAGGAGFGTHDVSLSVNGIEVWSQIDITADVLAQPLFTAGSVNMAAGENVLEIVRTGGTINDDPANTGWIQFDYLQAEINTNTAAPPTPPVITGVTRDPATGALTLSWTSQPGQTFLVESSNNLVTWPDLATNYPTGGATGTSTSYTHQPASTDSALYYRISRQ